jgi:hypothetical protein
MPHEINSKDIFIKILLVLVGLLAGFGFSQITVAGQVQVHSVEIANLKEDDQQALSLINILISQNTAIVNQNTSIVQLFIGNAKK